ncbi:META domain-containing protein [uncultured Algibacter sp.]|uniref:META domain-containing protein n=1 Tax=uncultured Algibacter sp. TaxID=298659 RepID=UPI00260C32BE|nr:META domain-containing protein [uncultured Algibacter sp.]
MKFIIAILSIIILRCCWGPSEYQVMQSLQLNDSIMKELNGTYKITNLHNADVSSFELNITFNKDTKGVNGFSGCNRFFGSYTLDNEKLKFDSLGSTRMSCQDDANNIEAQLLKALESANTILFNEEGFSLFKNKILLLSAIKETQIILNFEYTASSRGYYKNIKINKKQILVSNKRGNEPKSNVCSKSNYNKLIEFAKKIEINNLPNLEPPSKNHQFDGAPLARLNITYNGDTYETQSFDHGNPHITIASLVKEILSIAENIE